MIIPKFFRLKWRIPFIRRSSTFYPLNKNLSPDTSAPVVFELKNVTKKIDVDTRSNLLKNISFKCLKGARVAIIGVNGSGKSTLMNIIAQKDNDIEGSVTVSKNETISLLTQSPKLDEKMTIIEFIKKELNYKFKLIDDYFKSTEKIGLAKDNIQEVIKEHEKLEIKMDDYGCWSLEHDIDDALKKLKCPDKNTLIANLSGGQKRKVSFCVVLLSNPDILLLDEPTNHLDMQSINWLADHLSKFAGTLITITHDRYFLDKISQWILEIDSGKINCFQGNFSEWTVRSTKITNEEKRMIDAQVKKIERNMSKLTKVKAKNKSKMKKYNALKDKKFQILDKTDETKKTKQLLIPEGPRLGGNVIEIKNLSVEFDKKTVLNYVNLNFTPGSIFGIVGPNGSGKTTLLRAIVNEIKYKGEINIGSSAKIVYVAQIRNTLNENNTVWEEITQGQEQIWIKDNLKIPARNYVAQFTFQKNTQNKRIESLSGGERNRVSLAKALKKGGNVLLLDEPSNDLDIITLTALEESLQKFNGVVICISHDRYFLEKICNYIIDFDGKGNVKMYNGNYEFYLRHKNKT